MEVGGWVQVSLGIFVVVGKSSQNSPKPVLIFWSSIHVFILSVYTWLKVVGYYDLSVLSMSVMVSKNEEVWMGFETYPIFFGFFNFARPLRSGNSKKRHTGVSHVICALFHAVTFSPNNLCALLHKQI